MPDCRCRQRLPGLAGTPCPADTPSPAFDVLSFQKNRSITKHYSAFIIWHGACCPGFCERTIMTAQAVAPTSPPPDPVPAAPAAPESGGGGHFLAVFAGKPPTTPQSAAAAPSNPPAANVAAATRPVPLRKVPGAADQ